MNSLSGGLLLALALLTAAGPLGIDMYLPGLPSLTEELGTTPAMAQLTITGFMAGMAVGNLLFGAISDSTGRKRPILVSSAVFFLASVLCALAPSIELLIAARVVQGLAGGTAMVVARAIIPDVAHGRAAARAFSGLMAITGFTPAIAPVLGGVLLPAFGWRGVFWTLAAVNVAQFAVALFLVGETLPASRRSDRALRGLFPRIGRCLRRPAFVGYMLASGLGFGSLFSYIAASPLVLQSQLGASPTLYAALFGSMALLIPASNAMNMRAVNRFHPRTLLRTALGANLVVGVVLFALSRLDPALPVVVAVLATLSLMAGFIMANATALGVETIRDIGTGSGNGAMGFFQFVVGGTVAPTVALGANHLQTMSLSVMVCAALALVAVLALTPRYSSGSSSPAAG
ncbi:multidrug effflux MFS transporter [Corynebacterium senegalense]|uniref:multidrug effflux MFS transporter n=1 Tax=Corynebacterium senegalense TaxID=2080750 RepID=UPI000E206109|nr:multidrug effflux MFS transporter [Corynebacterium senegalense]